MPLLRFVHAADLHLDSPFTGLKAAAPDNVANALYDATFTAYENIIDLCIDERVDALLVAGDVYDSADRSLRAQLKFVEGLKRLDEAGIRSFVCHGNHDPLDGWEAKLDYPPGCKRFGAMFEAAPVFEDDPQRAVVHGISYPTRDVYDNLALRVGRVDPNTFSIGLMHANVDGNADHAAVRPVFAGRPRILRHRLLGARPRSHPTDTQRPVADRGLSRQLPGQAPERARRARRLPRRGGRRWNRQPRLQGRGHRSLGAA